MKGELVTMALDEEQDARVAALAKQHKLTLEQMLARIVACGITLLEKQVREASLQQKEGDS
jgi:hypothetical protein